MQAASRIKEDILVLKAQMGDEDAFVELVERYHGRLLYYIRRFLKNPDHADDILQNVWLTVYKRLPRLRSRKAFSVWLYRIARTQAIDLVRKESRYVKVSEDFNPPDASSLNADKEEFSADDAARIHRALERLSPPHREVLVLRFLEGMSYEEIAEVTGCPLGTVKSQIYYAKRTLRREMEVLENEKVE